MTSSTEQLNVPNGSSRSHRRHRQRGASAPSMSITGYIYGLLGNRLAIELDGRRASMTTLEIILLKLYQKELSGDHTALAVRLKYERLAHRMSTPSLELVFVDQDCRDEEMEWSSNQP
ncbi:hypothetical protein NLM27_23480 [Bradyrhizobium sp. CCGB12]|uniref:hypothetical protein n=1 Tax=Bradyrhizobium sp. CCGB12 TaxID=2949632 RepID=UPI0020B25C62|nr:hypothetical protein [Bradyrhizobium sp. CCGB12]MCP3391757.1 hypothetical protein [Bradyrhizobium sp. CCGB12]